MRCSTLITKSVRLAQTFRRTPQSTHPDAEGWYEFLELGACAVKNSLGLTGRAVLYKVPQQSVQCVLY